MSYDNIHEYLRNKIVRVNVNNPKANWGARLLSQHMDIEMLDDHLMMVIDLIQVQFNINSSDSNPSGQAALTAVSMSIGKEILRECGLSGEGKPWMVDQIRTGDLFVEAFVKYGCLDIERVFEHNDDGDMVDIGYIVKITEKWVELFRTTPRDLTSLRYTDFLPYEDGCLIKGEANKRMQDRPWRRSATKLMSTPWRVNAPVLEALRANKDLFVSEVPLEVPIDEDGNPDPYMEKQEQRRASKLVDFMVVTAKASLLEDKEFYQEVEADYRGRLYYKEPFFNFQGSDLARGIMLFGEAKEVTPEGEYWLAVHTASSYNKSYDLHELPSWTGADYKSYLESEGLDSISVDKFTLDDRVRWFNENKDWILDAGRDREFFPECEKPISFLACCIEWHNIMDHGVSMSRLPVGIDGSNNGWQHLGAISKDARTGKLVGLVAQEIQQDFYVQTAKKLLEVDDPILNSMPMKHVRKGVSKRGSMTRAYSAGAKKIGENMWFDCRSYEYDEKYGVTKEDCMVWAKQLIKAINEVCPGPLVTMKYMQDLVVHHMGQYKKFRNGKLAEAEHKAIQKELRMLFKVKDPCDAQYERRERLIEESKEFYSVLVSGNGSKSVDWTTPSGFPVNYTAFREDQFKCKGTINGERINHSLVVPTDIPDVHKFMCGISPNYIHSMDASHMATVIDSWGDKTFGAVHDSFSTHACDVEDMLAITKQVFVDTYDVDNYLDKIRHDITRGTDDIKQPTLGSLDIQEVYDSDYFFA